MSPHVPQESPLPEARNGCAVRLSAIVIVLFVNVPLIWSGPAEVWREAPVILAVAVLVDAFVVLFAVVAFRRRRGSSVPD